MKNFSVVVFLLIAGCAFSSLGNRLIHKNGQELRQCATPVLLGISSDLTPAEVAVVTEAMNWWNVQLSRSVFFNLGVISEENSAAVAYVKHGDTRWWLEKEGQFSEAPAHTTMNNTGGCIGTVSVTLPDLKQYPEWTQAAIVRHELGHVLGLGDTYDVWDIMGPYNIRTPSLNLLDSEVKVLTMP